MSVSPDGTLVATGGRDATVRVWSRATGDQLEELRVGDRVEDVQFSPDGRLLAVAEGEAVRIFDVASWDRVTSLSHDRSVPLGEVHAGRSAAHIGQLGRHRQGLGGSHLGGGAPYRGRLAGERRWA